MSDPEDLYGDQAPNAEPVILHLNLLSLQVPADLSDSEDLYGDQAPNAEPVILHLNLLSLQVPADLSDSEDLYGEQLPNTELIPRPSNKKRGPKVNEQFSNPPHGALQHPFIGWRIEKAGMETYMPQYAKQEGFAVNPQRLEKGRVIRWWCIHAGKYNNHRNLPADITRSSNDTTGRDPDTTAGGEGIRIRRGASQKIGCHFYVVFTQIEGTLYRCSGIRTDHTCNPDPRTWDRYVRYRNQNPEVRRQTILLANHGIRAEQAASIVNAQYGTRIQPNDIHRIKSLHRRDQAETVGVNETECQRLLRTITSYGDQYRTKVKSSTYEMECIFYWDPEDVQLARRFCQVGLSHNAG